MPHFHFGRLSVSTLMCDPCPKAIVLPTVGCALEHSYHKLIAIRKTHNQCSLKEKWKPCSSVCLSRKSHYFGALQVSVNAGESLGLMQDNELTEIWRLNEEVQVNGCDDYAEAVSWPKDVKRRWKRRHGNKGRVPWNKGIKHSAETRVLIKQKTIEALKDPQVRKKMSEHPRPHSDESKEKISSSLRQVWDKRLKWKRLREKFFLTWALSIAKAARKGGTDQQELDWDSYDKIKQEIALEQLHYKMEKEKDRELLVARETKVKGEKWLWLEKKQSKSEVKTKSGELKWKECRKAEKNTEELPVAQAFSLKQRLTEVCKTKATEYKLTNNCEASISLSPVWKKLDRELMKRDAPKEVSFAEQIRSAKCQRSGLMA